jgi:hypothetical protein
MKDEKKETSKIEEAFIIEEDINEESSSKQDEKQNTEAFVKRARKKAIIRNLKSALVMTVVSGLIFGFGLIWQNDTSLIAITDALWLVVILEFFIGWTLFVYNLNIFSSLIYSTKSFFLIFVGKKPKQDYYTYMKKIEDDPIPSYYYKVIFISVFILLIPAIALLIIFF